MAANYLKNILDRIETQLQNIDGGTNYNFTVDHNRIKKKFIPYTKITTFPYICIASVDYAPSEAIPRRAFECPIEVEIFGYVQDDDAPLEEAVKLAEDIELALYLDEDLNGQVKEPSVEIDCGTLNDIGVASVTFSGVYVWQNPT